MDGRYRPSMDPFNRYHKAPVPEWFQENESGAEKHEQLIRRISELEQQIETYESLLNELPEMFERKFQQRLEPFLERYRLLAEESAHDRLKHDVDPRPNKRSHKVPKPFGVGGRDGCSVLHLVLTKLLHRPTADAQVVIRARYCFAVTYVRKMGVNAVSHPAAASRRCLRQV